MKNYSYKIFNIRIEYINFMHENKNNKYKKN